MQQRRVVSVILAISLLSGCAAMMTPEQRAKKAEEAEARRAWAAHEEAHSMSPARLCKRLMFGNDAYHQYSAAAESRGIDCNSPAIQGAVQLLMQQDMMDQESNRRAAQNLQNMGMQMLQNNYRRSGVTCNQIGYTTYCN